MSRLASAVGYGLWLGLSYFALVFVAGFGLGVLRVFVVAPRLGEMAAVLLELPIVLTLAWWVSRRLTRHLADGAVERSTMGASALLLLLAADFGLALLMGSGGPQGVIDRWLSPPGAVGLLGQLVFGLLPLLGEPPPRISSTKQG